MLDCGVKKDMHVNVDTSIKYLKHLNKVSPDIPFHWKVESYQCLSAYDMSLQITNNFVPYLCTLSTNIDCFVGNRHQGPKLHHAARVLRGHLRFAQPLYAAKVESHIRLRLR